MKLEIDSLFGSVRDMWVLKPEVETDVSYKNPYILKPATLDTTHGAITVHPRLRRSSPSRAGRQPCPLGPPVAPKITPAMRAQRSLNQGGSLRSPEK